MREAEVVLLLIAGGVSILSGWQSLALMVKRLHDAGMSDWFVMLAFIPYLGPVISLAFAIWPGDSLARRSGRRRPPPQTCWHLGTDVSFYGIVIDVLGTGRDKRYREPILAALRQHALRRHAAELWIATPTHAGNEAPPSRS